ncbi:MAG TPA: SHOCT domain-containing protein [Geminocystis sp. M7585_C2015_104]|nr:SHOCT domain-containing protein [Geminocystis sp. M7585_C2015_104]
MSKSYFVLRNEKDLERAYEGIIVWFKGQGYEVQGLKQKDGYLVQARKTGVIRTLLGANLAFEVRIYPSKDSVSGGKDFVVETSRGKWIENIAGAGITSIFVGGIPIWTGVAMAGWGWIQENILIDYLEKELKFTRVNSRTAKDEQDDHQTSSSVPIPVSISPEYNSTLEELQKTLDKLRKAFEDGILTEEEFLRKKAPIERQIEECHIASLIEEKVKKLQEAFSDGILTQEEYETKLYELENKARQELLNRRIFESNKDKILKLQEALENGIITQEEYDKKLAQMGVKNIIELEKERTKK